MGLNKFMDMIFKRYSCPFVLIDEYISNGMLKEFIDSLVETTNDDVIWDIWLHKIYDKDYDEFRKTALRGAINNATKKEVEEVDTSAIINKSMNIIKEF